MKSKRFRYDGNGEGTELKTGEAEGRNRVLMAIREDRVKLDHRKTEFWTEEYFACVMGTYGRSCGKKKLERKRVAMLVASIYVKKKKRGVGGQWETRLTETTDCERDRRGNTSELVGDPFMQCL